MLHSTSIVVIPIRESDTQILVQSTPTQNNVYGPPCRELRMNLTLHRMWDDDVQWDVRILVRALRRVAGIIWDCLNSLKREVWIDFHYWNYGLGFFF
jgi:hypothetical protein